MRTLISTLLFTSTVLLACAERQHADPADIVLLNGGIYTVDSERSLAEAAAVRDGLIVAVGANATIRPFIGASTRVIDLEGRMAMPGIHDSHVHPLEGGYEQVYCNVAPADSVDKVISTLQACDQEHEGEWFNAVGLDLGLFGLAGPDKSILDGLSHDRYVFVDAVDGHAALVNDRVLQLVGFDADSEDPPGGVIERRPGSREPSGTVRESARDAVDRLRPPRDLATSISAMRNAVSTMNSVGITSIYDVWIGEHEMQAYAALADAGELTVRVLGAINDEGAFEKHTGADLERLIRDRGRYESKYVSYDSVKMYVDGVVEGETAALLRNYSNVDHAGKLLRSQDEFNQRATYYQDMGLQLHFHTMGDRAARVALDAVEYARKHGNSRNSALRHTLSHLALIDASDHARFAVLDAGASFTMAWAYSSEWTVNIEIPTLGRERVARMYPIRSVDDAGGIVLGGSDWNYGPIDPLYSIETAITRDNPCGPVGDPDFEVFGAQQTDLATMIDAYTINGAWQIHAEDVSGSIETGKRADIIVYDRDLFAVDPHEISEAKVELTVFDGRIVYRRDADTETD